MNLQLTDKLAFVAGSSRGIGKGIARAFLREGARVVITGRDRAALAACAGELDAEFGTGRLAFIAGDMTRREVIRAAFDETRRASGHIDILVANIGLGRGAPGWQIDDPTWRDAFEANFHGAVAAVSEAVTDMTTARSGVIAVINSIVGIESTAAPLPYSSAKTALLGFTKNLARQVAAAGVRVNTVAPGNIFFEGGSWAEYLADRRESVLKYLADEVPMQRFGTPEEIADVVVFLCSPLASFVTGACIVADGGQTRAF